MRESKLLLLAIVMLLAAGCGRERAPGGSPTGEPSTTPRADLVASPTATGMAEPASRLEEALDVAPTDASGVYFTDWSLIERYEGVPGLTSESDIEARRDFRASTNKGQAAPAGFGIHTIAKWAEVWGWDMNDLDWEAEFPAPEVPAYVLKLREEFELAPVMARFEQRGFTRREEGGAVVYSRRINPGSAPDWFLEAPQFALSNVAVLEEDRMLVLSMDPDAVGRVLAVRQGHAPSLRDNEPADATAERLGQVAAAMLLLDRSPCAGLNPDTQPGPRTTGERARAIRARLEQYGKPRPYETLGIGYRYEGGRPIGVIALHYPEAETARADLPVRRRLATEGHSLATRAPYSKTVFRVEEASVEGRDIVLRVYPRGGFPRSLFDMVFRRDLFFASCA